jgi:hypothetical protein
VVLGFGRRGPDSLLYDVYKVMQIVFNIPVRFKGNFKGKIFVDIISKFYPIRRLCAEGGWTRLWHSSCMHGYKNW